MRASLGMRAAVAIATSALVLPLLPAAPANADPDPGKIAQTVVASAVKKHLRKLQDIANANGGTRAAGTPGFAASRDYVAGVLKKAGYTVKLQAFEFPFFKENSTALLQRTAPSPKTYAPTPPDGSSVGEFATMTYSGSGDVTGAVADVDLMLPPGPEANASTSGCETSDFAGFPAGAVALVQRGTCTFQVKAENAQAAGASAVIIMNEGQPGRTDTLQGTLGEPTVHIPVVGVSFAVGQELSAAGTTVRVTTDTTSEIRTTHNVIADSRWGDANRVVQLGAHLDSVLAGPGINDNGSGSAAILEVATVLGKIPTRNKLRFSFWSAEELGLLGAEHYVASLSPADLAKIKLYLNFDMVGSPNYALKIYDGDDSDATGAGPGPEGSAEIEKLFEKYFDALHQRHNGTDFDGRSDYGPFIAAGIPSGGTFTGAEGVKTAEEQAMFGGTAGQAYDPCYHQACDTIANISDKALALNTGAIATAAAVYAFSRDLPGPDNRTTAAAARTTAATSAATSAATAAATTAAAGGTAATR
ncbi:M28 family peptidase [Microbispora sp. SCL1-1]|uniref:M28 family metallopeptidase n=1 Tax=Microbispora TaxID=2005 RepID=UPI00115A4B60|nr:MULTISPECIES: M28 family metallopeptidase [unclassified Microbispora]NJP25972.1 M28 family peptidase [Microbispora sp. CL1-1]TQS12753.1 M28 family peptidase [Microbispora sp. SCL1-1]